MIIRGTYVLLTALLSKTANAAFVDGKPDFFTADIAPPMAYYYLNDGSGYNLRESVSNDATAGKVVFVEEHQIRSEYSQPNWIYDDWFGSTIQCGKIDNWDQDPNFLAIQKDTLELADIDYGSSGSWAWSVWFRHDSENFPDYDREVFFGHGNPLEPTSVRNQVHMQFEKDKALRTILFDGSDIDRFVYSNQTDNLFPEQTDPLCYEYSDCRSKTAASTDTDPDVLTNMYNGKWHQMVLTTNPAGGKGYHVYIDGELQAASPYQSSIGVDRGFGNPEKYVNWRGVGGDPIDPVGPIRFCGRAVPAAWRDGEEGQTTFDKNRYYAGQIAHFSVWNKALSQTDVTKLYDLYYTKFGLETQYNTESPTRYPTNLPTQKPKPSPSTPTRNPPSPVAAPTTRTNPPPSPTAPSMSPPTGQSNINAPKGDADDDDNDDGSNMGLGTGALIGGIIGGLVGFGLLIGLGFYALREKAGGGSTPDDSGGANNMKSADGDFA